MSNIKQREVLAQFYSNFALAWFSFGLISPIYSSVTDVTRLLLGVILSLLFGGYLLYLSLLIVKK